MSYFAVLRQLPAMLDAFGRLRISDPHALFSSTLLYDNAPALWNDVQISGAGTSSTYNTNQSSVTLSTTAVTAGRRVRQTYRRFLYQPGKSQLVSLTGVIGEPATGITRGIGLYDDNNGVFFQSAPTTINVVIRTFTSGVPVDALFPQALWNIDKMNGSGPSGGNPSGIDLDFDQAQIFFFDFQWLGVGLVRFGFVVNGIFYPVHAVPHSNLTNLVYMSIPNLPLRYEISSTVAGAGASLVQICNSVLSEGGIEFVGQVRAVSRNVTPLVTLNDNDLYPLIAIRMQSTKQSTIVQPTSLSVISTTNADLEIQVLLNPTIAGTGLSFSAVPNSSVEADVATTNASKVTAATGTLLASALVAANASIDLSSPVELQLGASIAGVSDILVLAVRRLTGATETIYGSLGWHESN